MGALVKIEFTKDFATKKKGETWECENSLASNLVNRKKVAKYGDEHAAKLKSIKEVGERRAKARKEEAEKLKAKKKEIIAASIKAKQKLEKEGK